MPVTKQELSAGFAYIATIAETIREVGEIPSGHLYAQLVGRVSLQSYNKVLQILTNAKLITVSSHLIKWTGPKIS